MEDPPGSKEIVSKFEKIDFESLWKGREKVDLLEKKIVSVLLSRSDGRRILELGTGNGRMTGLIHNFAEHYVGSDINRSFLKVVREQFSKEDDRYVASNLYHLPFANNSFSCVVMIRVFNFLSQPLRILKGLSRIIIPGGYLLISMSQKPSLSTLIDDLKYHLTEEERNSSRVKSVTFSRADISRVRPASSPTFAFSRKYVSAIFASSGFEVRAEISSGLEDYSVLARLPLNLLYKLGRSFPKFCSFPTTFFLLQKNRRQVGALCEDSDMIRCPVCEAELEEIVLDADLTCRKCGTSFLEKEGILDMTYIPENAEIADEGEWTVGK